MGPAATLFTSTCLAWVTSKKERSQHVTHRDSNGFLLSDQHHKPLAACDASVEQVSLQHRVMLREYRDDHGGIFRTLAFVDRRGIGRRQHVEFAKSVSH